MDLYRLLEKSLAEAQSATTVGTLPRDIHRNRSQAWIRQLGEAFLHALDSDSSVRVFTRGDTTHRADFGLNELLYDVLVCRVNSVPSAKWGKPLYYIEEALWQVESEFARDSKQALIDFNKLVLGSGRNKLFIGPQVSDKPSFIEVLLPAARACIGNVYVALVPHPRDWGTGEHQIDLWMLENGLWREVC
jgi:hypothetical protein